MKRFVLALIALAVVGSTFAQAIPTPVASAASSPISKIVAADGKTILIVTPNTTIGVRPPNAPGGVYNMLPTTAFYVNHAAVMKPIVGSDQKKIHWEYSTANGVQPQPSDSDGSVAPGTGSGEFRTTCKISHMKRADPLVYPGRIEAGHLHTFAGNSDMDGLVDEQTITNLPNFGRSTCDGGILNRTGYWFPSLINTLTGVPVVPEILSIYYKVQGDFAAHHPLLTQVPPPGLRMITGDPSATAGQNDTGYFQWVCSDGGPKYDHIPTAADLAANPGTCMDNALLQNGTRFPECWDGVNLDSPGHKAHLARQGYYTGCPSTHPVPIPQVSPTISYSIKKLGGRANIPNNRLSSDNYSTSLPGGYSMHMDWVNGWNPEIMQAWVNNCDRSGTNCHDNVIDKFTTYPYRILDR